MVLNKHSTQSAKADDIFNLISNPWIPVRFTDGGRHELLGLEELFRRADAIEDLDCAPHERIALLRLLACITHAALGAPESPEEWDDFGSRLTTEVPSYLKRPEIKPHFNLLGEGPRFLQVPVSSAKEAVDITKLVFNLATGNNPTHFDHEGGLAGRSLSPAQAAIAILTFQNYYPPYGAGHKGKGPCVDRNMIHTLLIGDTLTQTILQNCLTSDLISQHFPSFGKPIWELDNDHNFENLATTTYLGRLVPRHRTIFLNDSLTGFHIDQKGMEYPNFEEAREPTSTLKIYRKQNVLERGLVDCKLNRAVWRDLHVFLVIKHASAEEVSAPLNLLVQSRRSAGDFKIWTGGLVTDGKAKIFDAIESTFTIPPAMFCENGRGLYQVGVEFAESQSYRLKLAVTEYGKAMKSESAPEAKAQNRYWHTLDRESPVLLALVGKPLSIAYSEKGNSWGDLVRAAAREAYEATCPRQTPRQIQAFAEGLKKTFRSETQTTIHMIQKTPEDTDEELIQKLVAICRDRGSSAELRRYWSPATRHYAFPVLGRIGVTSPHSPDAVTAALYAINPRHHTGGLRPGQALQRFAAGEDSFDAHVRRLLASDDLDDVADQLQRLFVRLEREGIALNYNRLLWDLRNWGKKSEDVKTRWGQDYWMSSKEQLAVESLPQ